MMGAHISVMDINLYLECVILLAKWEYSTWRTGGSLPVGSFLPFLQGEGDPICNRLCTDKLYVKFGPYSLSISL